MSNNDTLEELIAAAEKIDVKLAERIKAFVNRTEPYKIVCRLNSDEFPAQCVISCMPIPASGIVFLLDNNFEKLVHPVLAKQNGYWLSKEVEDFCLSEPEKKELKEILLCANAHLKNLTRVKKLKDSPPGG